MAETDSALLERALGHTFADPSRLRAALMHASLGGPGGLDSNERFEFLGDRVLGLIVAEMLLERFAEEDVGPLARRHVALVRREALSTVARTLDLGAVLQLSAAEEQAGGRDNDSILADACEAIIAALYLDGGLGAAGQFVRRYWSAPMEHAAAEAPLDAKTALQEWVQAQGQPLPNYAELGREGPAHAPTFRVRVRLTDGHEAEGFGTSKRMAEQAAAAALLQTMGNQ